MNVNVERPTEWLAPQIVRRASCVEETDCGAKRVRRAWYRCRVGVEVAESRAGPPVEMAQGWLKCGATF